jgi:hypothetical protein
VASRGDVRDQTSLKGSNSTDVSVDIADHFRPFQVFDVQI